MRLDMHDDVAVLDRHLVCSSADPWIGERLASLDVEFPAMPGAAEYTSFSAIGICEVRCGQCCSSERSAAKRSTIMWTAVVECKEPAFDIKDTDTSPVELNN